MLRYFFFLLFTGSFAFWTEPVNAAGIFNDSDSFVLARAVKLGRGSAAASSAYSDYNNPGSIGGSASNTCYTGTYNAGKDGCKACDEAMTGCKACDSKTKCTACKDGYKLVNNKCEYIPTQSDKDTDCIRYCGEGFYYDRPGAKNGGKELVCTKYPLSCGYGCTTGWDIDYLVKGTNYTCQTAIQTSDKNADCVKYCGEGFYYDRPGAKNNGQELVCTKYPLSCGYGCTTGWDIDYLVKGTNYTCQTAIQTQSDKNADCVKYCGNGFSYDRPGDKNGGQELVCTKYPLSCGYGCTTGWDIDYLVKGTNYTCQTAIQTGYDADCVKYCGEGFYYDRPGAKNGGKELVCTKYPLSCGYGCTTGWDIDYLVQGTNYTCQTAVQAGKEADCIKYCGEGFHYDRPGDKRNGQELVCTKYPKSCGYDCTTGWDIDYLVKGTNYTCQTAIQD